jgi:hypothetical protein
MGLTKMLEHDYYLDRLWAIAGWYFYGFPILILCSIGIWFPPYRDDISSSRRTLAFLPYVWLLGTAVVYLAAAKEVTSNPWNLHILSIPIAFFAGRGVALMLGAAMNPAPIIMTGLRALVLATIVIGFSTLPLIIHLKRPTAQTSYDMGQRLQALTKPGDLVVVVASDVGDPIPIYYSRRRGWVFPPGGGQTDWATFVVNDQVAIEQLEELVKNGAEWFAFAKDARDNSGQMFVEHHRGLIEYLNQIGKPVEDTAGYSIFRLPSS